MTNEPQTLIDLAIYQGNAQLQIEKGLGFHNYSVEHSSLSLEFYPLKLRDVLHVPTITKNLLLVHKLANDNNIYVEFHASYCLVKDEAARIPLVQGTFKDMLYFFQNSKTLRAFFGHRVSLVTWHEHLGHPDLKIL